MPGDAASDSDSRDASATVPRSLRLAAAIYSLFVLYGCLIPLDFTPVPWKRAWAHYRHIPELHPIGHALPMDFAANVLLFIPLAFLWTGVIGIGTGAGAARRAGAGAIAKAAAAWVAAVLFQAALEFGQVYLPPRSVSLWDVIAAAVGAAIGVAAWFVVGGKALRIFERWEATRGRQGVARWLVGPYAVLLFFYNVLPADLTLNVAALHRKWDRGYIHPIPFAAIGSDPLTATLGLATEALLWLPMAGLFVLGRGLSPFTSWGLTVVFATGIEALQLLVQSRISDTTDLVTAAVGAAIGVWLGTRIRKGVLERGAPGNGRG